VREVSWLDPVSLSLFTELKLHLDFGNYKHFAPERSGRISDSLVSFSLDDKLPITQLTRINTFKFTNYF
jgi:hypothetical protein